MTLEVRKAIAPHKTATSDDPWDGPANEANLSTDAGAATYRRAYAWNDPDADPDTKAAYKFIHHFVSSSGSVGAASTKGCSSGIGILNGGRGGTNIPADDRSGVHAHLAKHLRDAGQEPPPLQGAVLNPGSTEEGKQEQRHYERVLAYVSRTAWAMHPAALATIVAIVAERRSGHRPSAEEIRARLDRGAGWRSPGEVRELPVLHRRQDDEPPEGGVAVIPISGPIVPKADLFTEVSGGASVEGLTARLRDAVADPAVRAIVLDVDSPGGSVDLIPEFAGEIMASRGTKPIVAVANTWAASAAYWLASAADELVVTPSGQVGSIGVYTAHDDFSAYMAMKGIKTTLIAAGDYKVEANPFEALDDEARAELQRIVDAYYRMFVDAVAAQRGVTVEAVEADFGQGRMVMAGDAVAAGMADRVATLDETVAELKYRAPAGLSSLGAPPAVGSRRLRIEGKRSTARLAQAGDVPELVQRVLRLERECRVPWTGQVLQRGIRPVQLRHGAGGEPIVEGYASVFDVTYEVNDWLGSYEEMVAGGAFSRTLQERADVRLLINHEDLPLARTKSGTLELWQDHVGLGYRAPLDPTDPDVQRLVPKLERTDVAESSFSFVTVAQEWILDRPVQLRILRDVDLFDVSIVTWPANTATSAGIRAADMILALAEADPEELLVAVRSAGGVTPERMARALEVLQGLASGNAAPADRDTAGTLDLDMAQREVELLKLRLRA